MRRLLWLLLLGLGSCGGDPPPPACADERCCVAGSTRVQRCGSCNVGEVAVALAQCAATDAGNTCGDGKFTAGREQCDPSASAACALPTQICTACMCVDRPAAVCGDGMVTGAEDCESNQACSGGAVCRRCACTDPSDPVTFSDTMGDVPSTPQGYALDYIAFRVDGGNEESIDFGYRDIAGRQPDMLSEACLVIIVAAGQQQRLCIQKAPQMLREVTFTGVDGQRRVLAEDEVTLGVGLDSFEVRYKTTLGLRVESGLTFTVESRYAGTVTDVLPDTGAASFNEIFGL